MSQTETDNSTLDRILKSAESLFARQGFNGTSTRQICSAAGISIQTLHYHTGGKRELYNRILERSVIPVTVMINRHIQQMLKQDLAKDSVLNSSLDGLIDELFSVLHEHPNFPLLFFRQWLEEDPDLRRVEWESLVPSLRRWVKQVESIIDEDRRLGIDLPLMFVSLSILYWGMFTNKNFISGLLNMDGDSREYWERLKSHAKELTARLLGRPGSAFDVGKAPKKRKAGNR